MYAMIRDGNHIHKVSEGTVIRHSYRREWQPGQECEVGPVVLVSGQAEIRVGTPFLPQVVATAQVLEHGKDKKKIVSHFRRRKDSKTRRGHRQRFTRIKITGFRGL